MNENNILLIPDLDRLRQRLARPPLPLGELLARFRRRLDEDAAFRVANLYLPALLGEEWALREAKTNLLREATGFRERGAEDDAAEHHTWCVAPQAWRTGPTLNMGDLEPAGDETGIRRSTHDGVVPHLIRSRCDAESPPKELMKMAQILAAALQ